MRNHYYLEINAYHLSVDKAKQFTIKTLEMIGVEPPTGGWDNSTINITNTKFKKWN